MQREDDEKRSDKSFVQYISQAYQEEKQMAQLKKIQDQNKMRDFWKQQIEID